MSEAPEELEVLRRQVAAFEADTAEMRRRSRAAVAQAERQAAWLDELDVDLNALMAKRGADELRALFRGARAAYRFVRYRLPRWLRSLHNGDA